MAIKEKNIERVTLRWKKMHAAAFRKFRIILSERDKDHPDFQFKIVKNAVNNQIITPEGGSIIVCKRWTSPWGSVKVRLRPGYDGDHSLPIDYSVLTGSDFGGWADVTCDE
jgi:hypothetical protein